jgi:hypothetical protein
MNMLDPTAGMAIRECDARKARIVVFPDRSRPVM